jgi:hypothetical protein
LLITAFALMYSSFSTPMLSGLFTLSTFVIGHLVDDIKRFGGQSESEAVRRVSSVVYYILPNLENFNLKNQAVHDVALKPGQLGYAVAYGVIYGVLVLAAAVSIFQSRDFK